MAGEEAADDFYTVVLFQLEFAGGGYFVVGGEAGYSALEEFELLLADVGVGCAGTCGLLIAPGEVADACEEGTDVGQLCLEEDYRVDEGALLDDDLFADGPRDFLAGVEELEGGERSIGERSSQYRSRGLSMDALRSIGFGEELDAAADLGEADAGAERHGIPSGRVVEEDGADGSESVGFAVSASQCRLRSVGFAVSASQYWRFAQCGYIAQLQDGEAEGGMAEVADDGAGGNAGAECCVGP